MKKTVYDPASLMLNKGPQVKFSYEGMRGIRTGQNYDLSENTDTLASILKDSYGAFCTERIDGNDLVKDFTRRPVASGGALYPNNLYVLIPSGNNRVDAFQYNPVVNSLVSLGIKKCPVGDSLTKEATLICTKFYWRNWMKYRDFGYRLMSVDTGFLLGQLIAVTNKYKACPELILVDSDFKKIQDMLKIDLNFESIEFMLKLKSITDIFSITNKLKVSVPKNIDKFPLNFYKKLELEALSCENELKYMLKTDLHINSNYRNRISPGGAQLISTGNISHDKFEKIMKTICDLLNSFSNFLKDDIHVYVGINKVNKLVSGGYLLKKDGSLEKVSDLSMTPNEYQKLITRANFNLSEIPLFFAISVPKSLLFSGENKIQSFKEFQMKSGFVGELLTIAANSSEFFIHPILGYDALNLEHAFNVNSNTSMTCLLPVGEMHTTDRIHISL